MKRYIDADKLRALLVERYNAFQIGQHSPFRNGKVETLRETIELIDSLQQEQPEVDLEKEIYTCFEKYTKDAFGIPIEGRITKFEVEEIAHHFYELGLNARKEK